MFPSADERRRLLSIAESSIPDLVQEVVYPSGTLAVVKSESVFLGWEAHIDNASASSHVMIKENSVIFDFGNHIVGYLSFEVIACPRENGRNPCRPDSPARIRIVFGEVLPDVCESFEPFTSVIQCF